MIDIDNAMKKLDQFTIEATHTASQLTSLNRHLQVIDSEREAALNHILTLEQEIDLLEKKYTEVAEAFEASGGVGEDIKLLEKRLKKKEEEMEETDEKYLEVCFLSILFSA
jgi:chromosome segregation ATPase